MESYKIYQYKKTEYGILAYLQNVKASKIGGRKTVFTAWNGSEDEVILAMNGKVNKETGEVTPPEEFTLDPKFIKEGTPYTNKNGKEVIPMWYKVV